VILLNDPAAKKHRLLQKKAKSQKKSAIVKSIFLILHMHPFARYKLSSFGEIFMY